MPTKIIQATPEFSQEIALLLSKYFQNLNMIIGFENYKTDYQIMFKNVSERISNSKSPFKYFIKLDDAGNLIGFVNTLEDKIGEILVIVTKPEVENQQEIIKELFHFAKEYLMSRNCKLIMTELSEDDKVMEEESNKLNCRTIKKTVLIPLN